MLPPAAPPPASEPIALVVPLRSKTAVVASVRVSAELGLSAPSVLACKVPPTMAVAPMPTFVPPSTNVPALTVVTPV